MPFLFPFLLVRDCWRFIYILFLSPICTARLFAPCSDLRVYVEMLDKLDDGLQ